MASQQLRVIIDDNAGDIQYTGGQWTLSTLVQWYQVTSNYPAFASNTSFGSLTFAFEALWQEDCSLSSPGTSAAFIGNIPTDSFSQSFSVSIDGGAALTSSYASSTPPAYIQWYQTPVLSDGTHTVQMSHLDGTAVDMVIVTVGPNTPLAGKNIFVDNNDPSIQYSGSWVENGSGFEAGSLPSGLPVGNTTQQSTKIGDTMTFRFSGTSISIYGIFSWTNIGVISATYTLDGKAESLSYPVTSSSAEHLTEDGDATNFLFYEKNNLSAGAHTLVLNITDLENNAFNLDFITYAPSFSTSATMPALSAGGSSTISTGNTAASGATSAPGTVGGAATSGTASTSTPLSGSSTGTLTAASSGSSASSAGSIDQPTQTGSKGSPIGAIVGGVLGGLAVLVLFAIFLLYMRRRRPAGNQSPTVEQHLVSNGPQMSGPSGATPMSRDNVTPFAMSTAANAGFASLSDSKRSRMETDLGYRDGAPSPFTGSEARSNTSIRDMSLQRTVSPTASQPNTGSGYADTTSGLEYVSESVPPAYDALSTHRVSTLGPVRR
ncbi:hypothetical protein HYPSUDRAFT_59168 [Hypholoma sublateritium FD-334 SS-4]|uniref:Uncharacterized protein n=1 Tax=Hypholoma sublateritium (strain FD-334 SS-4) TaxID=945553 RepID=A0A0D2NDY7_HYPSF|nr:hypothetical protein HYPSUDRAFT_59168 [Hypholoma sublateritium FD-334 SS-4]